jgi:cell wall-associated NlpC family hydrolase
MKTTIVIFFFVLTSCNLNQPGQVIIEPAGDTSIAEQGTSERLKDAEKPPLAKADYVGGVMKINTGNTSPNELVSYAKSLIGIPYKYGSIDPSAGFDCSGFITYVFNHFNIAVPRSSIDFTEVSTEINLVDSKPGDIVLFTGTDSAVRHVGHMGIIVSANGSEVEFIHSTSGKANGVTVTPLNKYYQGRYVKTIRIFPQNDNTTLF